jgi:hypothetical protein
LIDWLACQHSVTGKNRERSLIKPDLKPMFVNSYITERKTTCVIEFSSISAITKNTHPILIKVAIY